MLYLVTHIIINEVENNMVIDFHTHVYPDKIAERTIQTLMQSAPDVKVYTKGTLQALLDSMAEAGIDKSVILPVATRKGQFDTINQYALHINQTYHNLVSFGGIHPDDDEPEQKLSWLKDNGFKGIKIHPDYTETFIDDARYVRILKACAALGLKVVTHAGEDPAFDIIHCPPKKARAILDRIPTKEPFLIFAHLGGINVYKEVEGYLLGTNCYIDVSCSFSELGSYCETTAKEVVSVIRRHGADKILFATDSPWNDQRSYLSHFRSLPELTDREKDLILYQNAQKILSE